jgi:hypothetical protein
MRFYNLRLSSVINIMAAQLITYDLLAPGRDYSSLHLAIKELGSWWHCVESTWIVDSALPPSTIRDILRAHLDANDKLVVLQLEGHWASQHLNENCNNWLREHVGS